MNEEQIKKKQQKNVDTVKIDQVFITGEFLLKNLFLSHSNLEQHTEFQSQTVTEKDQIKTATTRSSNSTSNNENNNKETK